MAKTETLHVRVDPDTKRSTDEILSVLGLSTAEAVNHFPAPDCASRRSSVPDYAPDTK